MVAATQATGLTEVGRWYRLGAMMVANGWVVESEMASSVVLRHAPCGETYTMDRDSYYDLAFLSCATCRDLEDAPGHHHSIRVERGGVLDFSAEQTCVDCGERFLISSPLTVDKDRGLLVDNIKCDWKRV